MLKGIKERYLVDDHGNRVAVVLDVDAYNQIIEELEELEDIRAFDAAKASGESPIPIEQAITEIQRKHRGK
jgi:PHD/YefM family antitoxin component YafN of YafNO toxin-antitoxin module